MHEKLFELTVVKMRADLLAFEAKAGSELPEMRSLLGKMIVLAADLSGRTIPADCIQFTDLTINVLIEGVLASDDFLSLSEGVQERYDSMYRRIAKSYGNARLADIEVETIQAWYDDLTDGRSMTATGYMLLHLLRKLFDYGITNLENRDCARLVGGALKKVKKT